MKLVILGFDEESLHHASCTISWPSFLPSMRKSSYDYTSCLELVFPGSPNLNGLNLLVFCCLLCCLLIFETLGVYIVAVWITIDKILRLSCAVTILITRVSLVVSRLHSDTAFSRFKCLLNFNREQYKELGIAESGDHMSSTSSGVHGACGCLLPILTLLMLAGYQSSLRAGTKGEELGWWKLLPIIGGCLTTFYYAFLFTFCRHFFTLLPVLLRANFFPWASERIPTQSGSWPTGAGSELLMFLDIWGSRWLYSQNDRSERHYEAKMLR